MSKTERLSKIETECINLSRKNVMPPASVSGRSIRKQMKEHTRDQMNSALGRHLFQGEHHIDEEKVELKRKC